MQSETAMSRELMGKIVDEVFDGAIEDASVIEEIYAIIKREEAALSKVAKPKPLDLNITEEWFKKRAALEGDHEIGAGSRKLTACIDPTPDELAELFKIAHRIPEGWQLVPVAALSAAEADELYNADALMNDGGDNRQTAAEEVLTYLLIEVVGAPDDVPYSATRAGVLIEERLKQQQPAPSVAVKALEWVADENHSQLQRADFYTIESGFRQGFALHIAGKMGVLWFPTEREAKAAAQSDYDARIRSALSAQVQDVAGWQPIETAPKDGSTFLAVMAEAYSPRTTLCKFENGGFLSPSQGEKFVVPGWNQWWPTHWMPLPAAPAKQEG